jgi:hypothetical protein
MGMWMALGAGIGTAMGAATHNMGVWLAIGISLGVAIDVIIQGSRPK